MKNKNNIFILLLISICLLQLVSCDKTDLDLYPEGDLSTTLFFQDEIQTHQALMGVYSRLHLPFTFDRKFIMEGSTDIAQSFGGRAPTFMFNGTITPNEGKIEDKWQDSYDGIAQANIFIANAQEIASDIIDPERKAEFLGEAKFLRALYYNELLNFFGGVPIYDETTDVSKEFSTLLKPRSTADQVRQFIIDDLTEAANGMALKWDGAQKGRATKSSALALRGRVYLYNKEYDLALADFLEVLKPEHGHELYPDFAGLFKPGGDESSEIIFAVQSFGAVGALNGIPFGRYLGTRSSFFSGGWHTSTPSIELANYYEYKDGTDLVWDDVFPGFSTDDEVKKTVFLSKLSDDGTTVDEYPAELDKLVTLYDNLDPRFHATVIAPYSEYLGVSSNQDKIMTYVVTMDLSLASNGLLEIGQDHTYYWRKFVPEGNMDGALTNRDHVPINLPIIRLADVYLMIAECYNKIGDQGMAAKYINMVRSRPGVDMPDIKETSQEDVFNRIVRERAVELAGEGLRHDDLVRWKLYGELLPAQATELTGERLWDKSFDESRQYLWPIPFNEIQTNPLIKQNPNW